MPKNYTDGDMLSSTSLNNATIHKMTGAEIVALTSAELVPGYLIYCTVTSAPYTIGNLYVRNSDNTAFEIVGLKGHTHTDATSGGTLPAAEIANIPLSFSLNKRFARAADFYQNTGSGGSIADDSTNGRINISTNATSGGFAQIFEGGGRKLSFTQPAAFETTLQVSSSTNFIVKLGVEAEDINAASNANNKWGIEGCSSSGSAWLLYSANGTRSTTTTSANVATGASNVYRVEFEPGTSVKLYVDGTLVATKTTNVPSTSTSTSTNVYRACIKNTAAENKVLHHHGVIVEGYL